MDYKIRIEELPSSELRDWLFNDVIVTLWESRPVFTKFKEEGADVEVDRVVMDEETELPVLETRNLGIIKVNFFDWLKKSPENSTYSSSQKKADKAAQAAANTQSTSADTLHNYFFFYSTDMLMVPEFTFDNKNDRFKDKDTEFMVEHLVERETEEAKIKAQKEAEALAASQAALGGAKGKADPKKDAKAAGGKPGAKGAAPVDDKNAPQAITVEYAQIEDTPNYIIYEKEYKPKFVKTKTTAVKKDNKAAANHSKENKNKLRKDELIKKYNIIRALPYSMAVEVKLNKDEHEEVEEPEPVKAPTPVETKPKGKT